MITCRHGRSECVGNMLQLCVGARTPPERDYDWFWGYITCSLGFSPHARSTLTACLDKVRGEEVQGEGAC